MTCQRIASNISKCPTESGMLPEQQRFWVSLKKDFEDEEGVEEDSKEMKELRSPISLTHTF